MSNDSTSVSDHNWEVVPDDSAQGTLAVPDDQTVTIGRHDSCELVIADPYISRQHASLEVRDGNLYLKDLDSAQGTLVNDARITETQVSHGDVISLENYHFTVRQLDYREDAGAADYGDATVIRKIPDPAEASTVILKSVQPPPVEKPAVDAAPSPPPVPEPAPPLPEPPLPPPEPAPPVLEPAAPPPEPAPPTPEPAAPAEQQPAPAAAKPDKPIDAGQPAAQDEADEGVAARKGNWWEKQEEGPQGTQFFKVGNLAEAGVSSQRDDIVADGPMLVGLTGVCQDQEYRLQSGKFIMGRGDSADIHIADTTVSDVHAQIIGDGVSWQVVNLIASNGTFVNGKKIQTAFLSPGDVIRMGGIELQFVDSASPGGFTAHAGGKSLPRWMVLAAILTAVLAGVLVGLSYFGLI